MRRSRLWIGALAVALSLLAAMASQMIGAHGLLLANGQIAFGDFMAFWSAGRLALDGRAADVHDAQALLAMHRAVAPDIGALYLWHHPPTFLLLVTPFAALPYPIAALAFLAFSAALYMAGVRALTKDRLALLIACAAPAALFHLGTAQTGLLTAGLSALALAWRRDHPMRAGACVALVAVKPHLALLWPLLFIVERNAKAFAYAALFTTAFIAASLLAFGIAPWQGFADNLANAQAMIDARRLAPETFASLYGALVGAARPAALFIHGVSAAAALALTILIWRASNARASMAAFAAASLLMSPYLFFYDFTLLGVAIFALSGPQRARGETALLIFAWIAPALSLALGRLILLPIAPLAAWAMLILAARDCGLMRTENVGPHPARAPRR